MPQINSGVMFVIEGTDGSGKGTQFELLHKRLVDEGYDVASFDFPQYEQPSSYFVRQYLNGEYGDADEVGPYTASLFYALDRYQAAPMIREALGAGQVVLCNRFTGSNMAHQGTKFTNEAERRGYFIWLDGLEFTMLNIPRPDKNVVLRVPAEVAQKLVDKKAARSYTSKKRDIHEADISHLRRAVKVYDDMCKLFPKDFQAIDCTKKGKLLGINEIQEILWNDIQPLLPEKPAAKRRTKGLTSINPFVTKNAKGIFRVSTVGKEFLKDVVTSTTGDVYAFNEQMSPITIAAAMARLSRRGDDMRITILDEFAQTMGKDDALLKRVITAYGDDSVQQLVGQHFVVENASNLLTKKLEWGRLAAYLEQSTRYIYFDQKDNGGNYRYHVPEQLDAKTAELYKRAMDRIFDTYSELVRKLSFFVRQRSTTPIEERDIAWQGATRAQACDAIRAVLPVATRSTVGIYASGQALEALIMRLLADELPEAKSTGQKILEEARKVVGTFLERADKPSRGGAQIAYLSNTRKTVQEQANKFLSGRHSLDYVPVTLNGFWPKNELDLLPDMLYEHSSLSLRELKQEIDTWPYERRIEVFKSYMGERLNRRHKPGRALEKLHYSWDLVCDYGIFRDLQRHRMVDDLQWQQLSPRFGYDIPSLVEEAGLSEKFEYCFDISAELYSLLQSRSYHLESQYAVLLGHRMRWKVTYNAREAFHLHELRTSPQGHPGYRKLVQQMHEKVAEVHPLTAESMIFVNQGEDPELTRLAAEKYTQFKLQELDSIPKKKLSKR